jgi:sigma-E factor negative regulatory protein RseC
VLSSETQIIRAIVRALDGDQALVETEEGGCGRCHETGGCGGQNLSRAFCSGPRSHRVENRVGAMVGERVNVAIEPGNIRRSANLAYVLPLAAVLCGALAGFAGGGEPWAIAGALGGLAAAVGYLRRRTGTASGFSAGNPHIISRSS